MPYCPRCGVELDPSVETCPLCRTPIPRFPDLGAGEPAWPAPGLLGDPAKRYVGGVQIRRRVFGILTAVLAAASAAVLSVDLLRAGMLSWSLYAAAALCGAWGMAAALFLSYRRPLVAVPVCFGIVTVVLAAFDASDGRWHWFLPLGLPLMILAAAAVAGGWLLLRRARGYYLLGVVAGLLAVTLVGVDVLVETWLSKPALGWSLIVDVVLVPLTLAFFYLHFGLKVPVDLRRTFHL
jgi:hypothetical protein